MIFWKFKKIMIFQVSMYFFFKWCWKQILVRFDQTPPPPQPNSPLIKTVLPASFYLAGHLHLGKMNVNISVLIQHLFQFVWHIVHTSRYLVLLYIAIHSNSKPVFGIKPSINNKWRKQDMHIKTLLKMNKCHMQVLIYVSWSNVFIKTQVSTS